MPLGCTAAAMLGSRHAIKQVVLAENLFTTLFGKIESPQTVEVLGLGIKMGLIGGGQERLGRSVAVGPPFALAFSFKHVVRVTRLVNLLPVKPCYR